MADVERIDYHAGGDSDRGEREAIVPAIDLADRPAGEGGEEGADVDTQIEERIAAVAPVVPGRIEHADLCRDVGRSEEHTSELQSLMRISYAVFCLKQQTKK